jgi:DNA-binding transcriptional MerR regulator
LAGKPQIAFEFEETPELPEKKKRGRKPSNKPPRPKAKRGRKSLKEMDGDAEMIQIPPDDVLKQKLYHGIGAVCDMFGLNPSTLRYWEAEFTIIKPRKNNKGDRFYTVSDIKIIQMIYFLLRQRKYTIEAAKDYLKNHTDDAQQRFELVQNLQQLKAFLLTIKADL